MRISTIYEQWFPFPANLFFFLRSASIAVSKTPLKDKPFGSVWLFHRPKFRAYNFPKELSADRWSGMCSVRRSFLSTSFLHLSSSPLGLSIKPYGSSIHSCAMNGVCFDCRKLNLWLLSYICLCWFGWRNTEVPTWKPQAFTNLTGISRYDTDRNLLTLMRWGKRVHPSSLTRDHPGSSSVGWEQLCHHPLP